ncbi:MULTISPECIES: ABC transporter ATP-binding protein [unclassified Clostridium]|uniref:ABC transporter ATP-binding protein n=1 Tax=unclassified Clostridium TaxID=2614128 RepID=UPI0032179ABE
MDNQYSVEFKNVSKIFKLKKSKGKSNHRNFYALKDISFKVEKGDVVGVLGTNGSGKSTLSSILAGISEVDAGSVKIVGEQSLIAINTGLNSELTGLENIKMKGALLGLSKKRIDEITEGVIEFAELGDFLYQPLKTYSSGMKSRLGFSISINLNPDIVIIDEALSVGDSSFSAKCIKKIEEFKTEGKTIFFISHSISQIKSFCNKGLWIEGGYLMEYGDLESVADKYEAFVNEYKNKTPKEKKKLKNEAFEKRIVVNRDKDTDSKIKIALFSCLKKVKCLLKVKG